MHADSPAKPGPHRAIRLAFPVLLAATMAVAAWADAFAVGARVGRNLLLVGILSAPLGAAALASAWCARSRWMVIAWAATYAAIVVLVLAPWHPRKRFVRDVYSVTPGMTVDEVERVLGGYIKGAGRAWLLPEGPDPVVLGPDEPRSADFAARVAAAQAAWRAPAYPAGAERAHATGTMTYRWSDDAAYNADWGQVTFHDGRVVKVEFLAD